MILLRMNFYEKGVAYFGVRDYNSFYLFDDT